MFENQEIQVVIQNSAKSHAIKHQANFPLFTVEKFLASHLYYPCNQGLIWGQKQKIITLVITPVPVLPGAIISCRSIGMLSDKIVAVPVSKLTTLYDDIQTIHQLPALILQQIQNFYDYTDQTAVA